MPTTINNSQPAGSISHPVFVISFLPGDSELPGLNFIQYQGRTLVAVDARMTPNQKVVLLFTDSCLLLRHSISTLRAA
jgi:hypothetical protein